MTPATLLALVAAHFDLTVAQLRSRNRTRVVAYARQAAAWVLRIAFPVLSLQDVGALLGGRDHTTIIFACQQVELRMAADPDLAAVLLALVALGGERQRETRPGDDRRFWGVTIARTA